MIRWFLGHILPGLILSALLAAFLFSSAYAQEPNYCAPYEVAAKVPERYGETIAFLYNLPAGGVEVWLNAKTKTVTFIGRPTSNPEIGCILMDGRDWRASNHSYPVEKNG